LLYWIAAVVGPSTVRLHHCCRAPCCPNAMTHRHPLASRPCLGGRARYAHQFKSASSPVRASYDPIARKLKTSCSETSRQPHPILAPQPKRRQYSAKRRRSLLACKAMLQRALQGFSMYLASTTLGDGGPMLPTTMQVSMKQPDKGIMLCEQFKASCCSRVAAA
jgi:hypothetical protein